MDWEHKDEWRKRGAFCLVTVVHYEEPIPEALDYGYKGTHCWNVYAYVYPGHRCFEGLAAAENDYDQAVLALPFHCGPSLRRVHRSGGVGITSIQIGSDYGHYGDERFSRLDAGTAPDNEVFRDAETLFQYLSGEEVEDTMPRGIPGVLAEMRDALTGEEG